KKSLIFFALAFPAPAAATLGRAPSPGDAGTRHGLNSSVTWSTMRPRVGEGRRDCPSTSPAGRPPDDGGPRRGGVRAGGAGPKGRRQRGGARADGRGAVQRGGDPPAVHFRVP